jgi:DNA polymerase-3 subunit delta
MKFSNAAAFLKQLHTKRERMMAVAAPDDYERGETIHQILKILGTPEQVVRFHGPDLDLKQLIDALETASLFGGETIAVVDLADKIPKAVLTDLQKFLPLTFGQLVLGFGGKSPLIALVEKAGFVFDLLDEKSWDKEKRLQELMQNKVRQACVTISSHALTLFLERQEKDAALLEREMEKLLCYIGERKHIDEADVLAIVTKSRSATLWHMAEELVWERKLKEPFDEASFHPLMGAIRSQLQLGLKITTLLEQNASREEWSEALPRLFAKTLEKRTAQAAKLGSTYFASALGFLFDMELRSRSGSSELSALFDLFRAKLSLGTYS